MLDPRPTLFPAIMDHTQYQTGLDEDGEASEEATKGSETQPGGGGQESQMVRTVEKVIPSLQNLVDTRPQISFPFMLQVYLLSPTGSTGQSQERTDLGGVKLRGFPEKGTGISRSPAAGVDGAELPPSVDKGYCTKERHL